MTTHRKQFGKRSLPQSNQQPWGQPQAQYAAQGAAPSYPMGGNTHQARETSTGFSLGGAIWSVVALFFSFSGRVDRLSFWGLSIFMTIIQFTIVKAYSNYAGLNMFDAEVVAHELINGNHALNLFIILLPPSIANFSLTVRRMHDRNVSGMWIFAWFIPILGTLICLCQTFANLFFAGTSGHNRYDGMQSQVSVFD